MSTHEAGPPTKTGQAHGVEAGTPWQFEPPAAWTWRFVAPDN
jgi:hypothetical protein